MGKPIEVAKAMATLTALVRDLETQGDDLLANLDEGEASPETIAAATEHVRQTNHAARNALALVAASVEKSLRCQRIHGGTTAEKEVA